MIVVFRAGLGFVMKANYKLDLGVSNSDAFQVSTWILQVILLQRRADVIRYYCCYTVNSHNCTNTKAVNTEQTWN